MRRYRSVDERVLQHMVDRATGDFVTRTNARYGLLAVSAPEFDAVLSRHGIDVYYHKKTRAQMYSVDQVSEALTKLRKAYDTINDGPVFTV